MATEGGKGRVGEGQELEETATAGWEKERGDRDWAGLGLGLEGLGMLQVRFNKHPIFCYKTDNTYALTFSTCVLQALKT